ncbi:hypothetical protein KKG46_02470, partial [Patescibacteria group bacterium]|nr:hypothetical protein [Patescibacteria group bacterium]
MENSVYIWKDGQERKPLPMDSTLNQIIDLVREHQVVVIQAPTGAGKTIRIPQALLLEFQERMLHMTLPRRAAVRWCGKYMASEMGSRPGGVIGWRLYKEEPVMSAETRLLMTVDQSLANRIRRTGQLPEGIIIVDEAHERSVSTDLLLGLIKEALPSSPKTKLLITSATIDTQKFSQFFGGAPVVKTTSRQYDVEVHVRELFTGEHHSQAAISEGHRVVEKFVQGQLTIAGDLQGDVRQRVGQGTLIVLLPGKEDIANALRELSRQAEELGVLDRVEILACHGETTPEDQDKVQSQVQDGVLRIVCGTEILRSSVTLPQVVGVIDSLQVKRNLVNERGVAHITKIAVSMAEADQAKGRAGRTGPGFYIPCSFYGEYGCLAPYPEPSIIREPTTSVALQVAAVGRSVRDFSFIDPPPPDKVEVAIGRLQAIG